jgi:hypothetical protein
MHTSRHNQLHDETVSGTEDVRSDITDTSVSDGGAGIGEVLRMRVGCWSPPVHVSTVPTAA